jgi:hypothetical protein
LVLRAVFYRSFVNQHNWNIVTNGINSAAFDAFQAAAIRLQFDPRLTKRTGKYFQQILTESHRYEPFNAISCASRMRWERNLLGKQSLS